MQLIRVSNHMKTKLLFLILLIFTAALTAEDKTDLKKYISSECNTLIGMDMKSLLAIPVLNAFLQTSDSKEIKQMNELGLKPQDVNSVIIGLNSQALANDPLAFEKQPELISLSIVKKGITLEKLIAAAKENKVVTQELDIEGTKAVILNKDGKQFAMAQISDKIIAVGSLKMLKHTIALKKGASSGSVSENKELSELASSQKGLFWVVGAKPKEELKSSEDAPLDNPMKSVFGDLKLFTLSLGFTGNAIQLNSDLICNDAAGADKLAVTAQLLTGVLSLNEDSPVKADQIKFTKNESTVNVKINIDSASLIKTLEAAKGLAQE